MGTNCGFVLALFCYVRDLMVALSNDQQADIIDDY